MKKFNSILAIAADAFVSVFESALCSNNSKSTSSVIAVDFSQASQK